MLLSAPLEVARTKAMHVGAERDERVRQVRAHEAVGARDEDGATVVDVAQLRAELGQVSGDQDHCRRASSFRAG